MDTICPETWNCHTSLVLHVTLRVLLDGEEGCEICLWAHFRNVQGSHF